MWIHLPNGRVELVLNEDHIKRLLSEGGREVSDPRQPAEADETEPEGLLEPGTENTDNTGGMQSTEDSTPPATKPKITKRGK